MELVWEYGYDKVTNKINKQLKDLFEQKQKEPERNVKLYAKIDGKTYAVDDSAEFIAVEVIT